MFYDEFADQFYDEENSIEEDRFLMLGKSWKQRVLLICHCERDEDVIRIISARKATKNEKSMFRGKS